MEHGGTFPYITDDALAVEKTLTRTSADGLMRATTPDNLVVSTDLLTFRQQIEKSTSLGLGLVGPTGCGRTTIVKALADPAFASPAERGDLRVLITTRITGEPLDFVGQFFETVTRALLDDALGVEPGGHRPRLHRAISATAVGAATAVTVGSLVPAGSIGALLEAARQGEMVRPWIMSCALVLVAGAAEAWGDRWSDRRDPTRLGTAILRLRIRHEAARRLKGLQRKTSRSWGIGSGLALTASSEERLKAAWQTADELGDFVCRAAVARREWQGQRARLVIGIDIADPLATPGRSEPSGPGVHDIVEQVKTVLSATTGSGVVVVVSLPPSVQVGLPGFASHPFGAALRVEHVRPLTLGEVRLLLDERGLDLPYLFGALCHCLAGGHPSEVQRIAEALIRAWHPDRTALEELCRRIIGDDVARTVRLEQRHAASLEERGAELLTVWADRALASSSASGLEQVATTPPDLDRDAQQCSYALRRSVAQLAAYFYWMATVQRLFDEDALITASRLITARGEDGGGEAFDAIFDCFAAARHLMPVKPLLLWEELNRIRPMVAQVPRAYPAHLMFARASAEVMES